MRNVTKALLCSTMLLASTPVWSDETVTTTTVTQTPVAIPAPVAAQVNSATADAPATPQAAVTPVAPETAANPQAQAASIAWQVLPEKTTIEWAANYSGKTITGAFKDFTAQIVFDPAHLESAHINVTMETAKITSDDKDAEAALPGAEWFDSAKTPQVVFDARKFRHIEDEKYETDGMLILGDKSTPVTLPFTVHFYDDNETIPPARYAQVTAETTIKRTLIGVGKGDWTKTDTVADDVKVTINLKAKSPLQPAAAP